MRRYNLILVQAFPANRHASEGAIRLLEESGLDVHFIELPGFSPDVPPLQDITLEFYLEYLQKRIDELALDQYILGGISFGAYLVQKLGKYDSKCKIVLNFEPFLGAELLKVPNPTIMLARGLTHGMIKSNIYDYDLFKKVAYKYLDLISGRHLDNFTEIVKNEVDMRTLINTLDLILNSSVITTSIKKPQIHILNITDNHLFIPKALNNQLKKISSEESLFVDIPIRHTASTYEYYKSCLRSEHIEVVTSFIDKYYDFGTEPVLNTQLSIAKA